jgi:hypothetical protein
MRRPRALAVRWFGGPPEPMAKSVERIIDGSA